uniref:snRNA-activating protein complex subunit 4 isoform X1 n=2 Tax=Pristiophorus japonicus TaxID=55135 RepID=UPI00398F327F
MEAQGRSEALQAERERIRREILELEQRLGVATETEPGSDDEEDEEEECISVAPSGEAPPQLADNNMDDEGDDLPEDPETCLQMNLVYQEVIVEKLQDLELLLSHNKEQQTGIMWDLAGHGLEKTKLPKVQCSAMYLGHFMKPYFKDKVTGLGPPANQDTKEKATQGIKSFEEFITTSWKLRDKEKLKLSIASDSTQRLLQPKLLRLEYLNRKLELSRKDMQNQTLKKQIGETEQEMAEINQMTQRQLLGNRFDDHDWIKIANIDFDGSRRAEDIQKVWQNSEHPSINRAAWSSQELEQLMEVTERAGCVDWECIASELQTNRTAYMCLQKYQEVTKDLKKKEWTKEEDRMLIKLVQKMRVGSFIPYTKIAYFMEGRNGSQLLYRWSKALDPTLKKGPWSRAEDALLLKAVAKYGSREWFKIQEEVPGRIDTQCRDRYRNGLNPNLRKGKWTPEEERDLKALIEKHGVGKWSKIAAEMPARTDTQVLSKWRIMTGIRIQQRAQAKFEKRRRRKWRNWESTSEESSDEFEDIKFQDEPEEKEKEEEEEEEEDPEEFQESKRKKRRVKPSVKGRDLVESIVLDVDRWVPVLETEPAPAGKTTNGNTATEQPAGAPKVEGQSRLGRPKSSKIWRSVPGPASAAASASEPDTKPREEELAAKVGEPELAPLPEKAQCPAVDKVRRKHRQTQGGPKKALSRASLSEINLEKRLIAAMIPWTSVRPVSREVDFLRERLEATGLSSTPVFILLIQVFRIDKEGCMQIIREKMNKDAQILSEKKQSDERLRRSPCLHQMKECTINLGNRRDVDIMQFKLECPLPQSKPKTVHELLAEKRRARARAKASDTTPQAPEQTRPTSPVQPRLSRWRTKSAVCSSVLRAMCGESPATVPALALPPGATAHSGQIQPAPSIAAAAPGAPKSRGKHWLQPIAPAPPARPEGVMVPVMLPNSTVPIMAMLTSQGLLCLPPGALAGLPNPAVQTPAPSVAPSPAAPCSLLISAVSASPAGQAPSGAGPQLPVDVSSLAPRQTVTTAVPAPMQPRTSPLLHTSAPPSTSSAVIHQAPAGTGTPPAPLASAPALSPSAALPALGDVQQPAANHVDPSVPTPPHTSAHLNQQAGDSPLATGVPGAGCSSTNPSGSAQRQGTEPPTVQSQPDKAAVDFKLLSGDPVAVMKDWLEGKDGVHMPGMPSALPYLPPFSATLRAFSNLLLHKKVLEQNLSGLGLAGGSEATDPKRSLEAARALVTDRLRNNPAHQLLKARFLSAFTLPAFLATLPLQGILTTVDPPAGELSQDAAGGSEADAESEDGVDESATQCVADNAANRELDPPFEISFADLSFGCSLPGSLEPVVGDLSAPEPPSETASQPEVLSRWSRRLRKRP